MVGRRDALQPRSPAGLLPGAGLSLLVHVGLVAAIALGVSWQRHAPVEFSAELWSALPELAAARAPEPPPAPAPTPAPVPVPAPAPPPPAATRSQADIALERERAAEREHAAEREAQRKREARIERERAADAKRAKAAEEAALKRQRELQDKRAAEQARKAEAARLEKQRQDNLKRLQAQAGSSGESGSGESGSQGSAARDSAPSQAYAGRLIRHIKSRLVMPDIDRLPPALEAVVEVRATASGTVLARRLVKPSGNAAWDNAVLRAIDGASPLPRDTDGRVPGAIEIVFKPGD